MAVKLVLDPIQATATFEGLDEHIQTVAIPIAQLTAINNSLTSLDGRLDTLEAAAPSAITYTVSFQPATP